MAELSVQKDIKLTRAEEEKKRQAESAQRLHYAWPLPGNVSDMKSFALGMLTWRDAAFLMGSFLIPFVLTLPLQLFLPQWVAIIIVAVLGIPLAFLSMRHLFTGDLPFEERVRIAMSERGESNLLHWDKTKQNGYYVDSSTQSFVPMVEFGEDNFVMLPRNKGGFAVIEVRVDDMAQSKNTEVEMTVNGFYDLLNALIKDSDCTPIQIMLKSQPKNLINYIDMADDWTESLVMKGKPLSAARAGDYASLLVDLDKEKAFYYSYYVVVTYREDAEHVGEETMNTASVTRKKIREKGMNPINKKAKVANQADFDIGMSEEERKQALKELNRDAEFGIKRTKAALTRRVGVVMTMLRDLGTTHTAVVPRILSKHDIAKLIFECYNTEDKNIIDSVLSQALEEKTTLYSIMMYNDYPELFTYKQKKKRSNVLSAQRRGLMGKAR